ncbi:hypothetical protein B4U78_013540 [Microbacterium esteraromaticum]|nr:hypothetical protein B4U78_013540 [Microbacterium esteraromaticum]
MIKSVKVKKKASDGFIELRMICSTIAGLWFGREVWLPTEDPPSIDWVDKARGKNLPGILSLYQERLAREYEGIEAVRRRAEFALTAIIAAAGLSATGFERLWSSAGTSWLPLTLWFIGLVIEIVAVLAFAGVAVASKKLGQVDPWKYSASKHAERKELREHVLAVHATSRTRRGAVTVFRDAFVIALVGLIPLGAAHVTAWATPIPPDPPVIVLVPVL